MCQSVTVVPHVRTGRTDNVATSMNPRSRTHKLEETTPERGTLVHHNSGALQHLPGVGHQPRATDAHTPHTGSDLAQSDLERAAAAASCAAALAASDSTDFCTIPSVR